jgi:hypothetical protein
VRIVRKIDAGAPKSTVRVPSGSLDRDQEIKRSMKVRRGIWDACIRRAQRDFPALTGRIVFTVSVNKSGRISGVTGPTGNAGAQYAAGCLLGEFSKLTFPPGRAAQIEIPFTTR